MISIRTKHITEIYGRELTQVTYIKRQELINDAFYYWRNHGFPYIKLNNDQIKKEFSRFLRSDGIDLIDEKTLSASTIGLSLANHFNPQMWHILLRYQVLSLTGFSRISKTIYFRS